MFLVFQVPVVDLRLFSQADRRLIRGPNWQKPDVGVHFLQGIGGLKPRNLGGNGDWMGERYFCSCEKWLKYSSDSSDRALALGGGATVFATPIFRRWLSDGNGVVRLELAWRIHIPADSLPLGAEELEKLIHAATSIRVQLKQKDTWTSASLLELRRLAAEAYEYATTPTENRTALNAKSLVQPCTSAIYLEYLPKEVAALPVFCRKVEDANSEICGIRAASFVTTTQGREVRGWLAERSYQDDAVRQFRINLLRMHAEMEGLERLIALWERRKQIPEFLFEKITLNEHFDRARTALSRTLKNDRKSAAFELAIRCHDDATERRSTHLFERVKSYGRLNRNDPLSFLGKLASENPVVIMNQQPASTAQSTPSIIYNVSGAGARVNVNSNDSSVNVVSLNSAELFDKLRDEIMTHVPQGERGALLQKVDEMEKAPSKSVLLGSYGEFIKLIAAHASIFGAYIPALTQLLT